MSPTEYREAVTRIALKQAQTTRRTCTLCNFCATGPTWEHIAARLNMHMHDKHGINGWTDPGDTPAAWRRAQNFEDHS